MAKSALVSFLMVVLLASGCFLSTEGRIEQLKSRYPQWDQSTIEKVAERRVEVGMTEEMVRAAMGKPESVTHDGDVTIWKYTYRRTDAEGHILPRAVFFIDFRNGTVIGAQGERPRSGFLYR